MRKLRVAIVAASLDIPGGQSVQADRLVRAWRGDPELEAWLVPVHWALPRRLRWAARIKGVPSFVMETRYLPRLVPGLARADVVHVFAAAYLPFLLAPLPALIVARALGRPVILNYRNGEAPDHLRQSAIARAAKVFRPSRNRAGLECPSVTLGSCAGASTGLPSIRTT